MAQGWTAVAVSEELEQALIQGHDSEANRWLEDRLGAMVDPNDYDHHAPERWDVIEGHVLMDDEKTAMLFKLTWV